MNFKLSLAILLLLIFIVFLGFLCIQQKREYFKNCYEYSEDDVNKLQEEDINKLEEDICNLNKIDITRDCLIEYPKSELCGELVETECQGCINCVWKDGKCMKLTCNDISNETDCNNNAKCIYMPDNATNKCMPNTSIGQKQCEGLDANTKVGWCIENDYTATCKKVNTAATDGRPPECNYWCSKYNTESQNQCGINWANPGFNRTMFNKCKLGNNSTPNNPENNSTSNYTGYAKYDCNLRQLYDKCIACADKNQCTDQDGNCIEDCGNTGIEGELQKEDYYKLCLNDPMIAYGNAYGFGCPNPNFEKGNLPPLYPTEENGMKVCEYSS